MTTDNRGVQVYHYTTLDKWRNIQEEGVLRPSNNKDDLKIKIFGPVTYALTEPSPLEWRDHQSLPGCLDHLLRSIYEKDESGLVLLRLHMGADQNPLVVDHFLFEQALESRFYESTDSHGTLRKQRNELKKALKATATPLREYGGQHKIPEVLIKESISLDKIDFVREVDVSALYANHANSEEAKLDWRKMLDAARKLNYTVSVESEEKHDQMLIDDCAAYVYQPNSGIHVLTIRRDINPFGYFQGRIFIGASSGKWDETTQKKEVDFDVALATDNLLERIMERAKPTIPIVKQYKRRDIGYYMEKAGYL